MKSAEAQVGSDGTWQKAITLTASPQTVTPQATDEQGSTACKTVKAVDRQVNLPPQAKADEATTTIRIDVLANDEDPNGDLLKIISWTEAGKKSVVSCRCGGFEYTPNPGTRGLL